MRKIKKEKMLIKSKEKGITLIVLVVTIIILLILAGVVITLVIGDNGIINRAKNSTELYNKSELKEELEFKIAEEEFDKIESGSIASKKDIANKLSDIAIILDYTDGEIYGEYKDHSFTVDENNKVIIGEILTGVKPDIEITPLDTAEGAESVRVQVTATTTDGEIAILESLDQLTPTAENGNADKIYTVTKNGEYKFKVIGTNGRIAIGKITISNLEEIIEAESLLKGISEITKGGEIKVKVIGTTEDGENTTYPLDVIYYKGNLTLGNELQSEGKKVEISNLTVSTDTTTWICGNTMDVNTKTVVLKVDGNLDIETGKILTSVVASNDGPKGMIVYCTGTLLNNGTISMTGRGSSAAGQNVYLLKKNNSFICVPKVGGTGGQAKLPGSSPSTDLGTGGGSGSYGDDYGFCKGRPGGNGTSYTGGLGGVLIGTDGANKGEGAVLRGGLLALYASRVTQIR